MDLTTLRQFFLWCSIINILLYFLGFVALITGFTFQLQGKWFKIPEDKFRELALNSMAMYKLGIVLFNVVPYCALMIIK